MNVISSLRTKLRVLLENLARDDESYMHPSSPKSAFVADFEDSHAFTRRDFNSATFACSLVSHSLFLYIGYWLSCADGTDLGIGLTPREMRTIL